MKRMLFLTVLCASGTAIAAETQLAELWTPSDFTNRDIGLYYKGASLVVVGNIIRIKDENGRFPSVKIQGTVIKTTRITAEVEAVLKGQLRSRVVTFKMNRIAAASTLVSTVPLFSDARKGRRILFLSPTVEGLRAVRDIFDTTITVRSGPVKQRDVDTSAPLGIQLANVLLRPRPGYSSKGLAQSLPDYVDLLFYLDAREITKQLLRKLTTNDDANISAAATKALRRYEHQGE